MVQPQHASSNHKTRQPHGAAAALPLLARASQTTVHTMDLLGSLSNLKVDTVLSAVDKYVPGAQNKLKNLADKAKAAWANASELEVKVLEATNHDPWGPHGSVMQGAWGLCMRLCAHTHTHTALTTHHDVVVRESVSLSWTHKRARAPPTPGAWCTTHV